MQNLIAATRELFRRSPLPTGKVVQEAGGCHVCRVAELSQTSPAPQTPRPHGRAATFATIDFPTIDFLLGVPIFRGTLSRLAVGHALHPITSDPHINHKNIQAGFATLDGRRVT